MNDDETLYNQEINPTESMASDSADTHQMHHKMMNNHGRYYQTYHHQNLLINWHIILKSVCLNENKLSFCIPRPSNQIGSSKTIVNKKSSKEDYFHVSSVYFVLFQKSDDRQCLLSLNSDIAFYFIHYYYLKNLF
jgi:hypothetical protein